MRSNDGAGMSRGLRNPSVAAGRPLSGGDLVVRAILINLAGFFLLDVMGLIIKHLSEGSSGG